MAARVGKDGWISFTASTSGGAAAYSSSAALYIDTWSLSGDIGLSDVTAFGDASRKYLPSVRGWTATAGGTLDNASTEQQNLNLLRQIASTALGLSECYLNMHENTTTYWCGIALLTGVSINSAVADKVGVTYNFQGSSALNYVAT
jgi:hypothetical protein